MDKLGEKEVISNKETQIDDKEDLEIMKVAHKKDNFHNIFLIIMIFLFCVSLGYTIFYINKYGDAKKPVETIELKNAKRQVFIVNNGEINKKITKDTFKENEKELKIENINFIELTSKEDKNVYQEVFFDVRYNIKKNFINEKINKQKQTVLLRISYSYDNENWQYINNVIGTDIGNISPLMGNYYDISNIKTNLKLSTNFKVGLTGVEKKKIYWKSETIIKNIGTDLHNKEYIAEFKIDYKN